MNAPPMQEEDDGFGDFRAKVKGLPPEQRQAALKEMEDAVLTNLRTNMLADLYEDQPTPAPGPAPAPKPAILDPNTGSYMYGSGTPEDDATWRRRAKEAEQQNGAGTNSGKPKGALTYSDGTPFQDWQLKQMEENGLSPEEYEDQPPYTEPLPKGSMTGKPYPSEQELGGGDGFYSNLYRWEKDNGVPKGMAYKSPEYHQFVQDYQRRNNFGPTPDLRPSDNGGGKGYPSIIDEPEPEALSAGPQTPEGKPPSKYYDGWEDSEIEGEARWAFGDLAGVSSDQRFDDPRYQKEDFFWSDPGVEELFQEYLAKKHGRDGVGENVFDESPEGQRLIAKIRSLRAARAPAPNTRSGMFGRPPGMGATRQMIDE